MSIEAMKQAVVYFEHMVRTLKLRDESEPAQLLFKLRQAVAEAEKQEPVAVKHMMEWVAFLKARSDNGQHKQIPSNLSAGACWDLAVELEQFINAHPQPKREWVGLTDEEINAIDGCMFPMSWARKIEDKLKEKNT